ncbi:Crp/Fnr family transcriptional regulator [Nonomuraea sp. K274]|uniref:Crp/Fnr family transcriptional regulator n=1 Tax=Nonomuraea cypriaca TaxID=1187855 RepID=A0A931A998_9ACTN|nr:Crp/Fnr family transcriptional regulator [Nonomuraea cypriaca]MBF8188626.1 Crp/Fnr family transcriptional regulator [Nonomuraea cypriaca]
MTFSDAYTWPAGTFMAGLDPVLGDRFMALSPATLRRAGHILIRQGDKKDKHVFLLRSVEPRHNALVKVTADLENGEQALLGIRVSGDLVGEMAPLRELPRTATVSLCSDCRVHAIPGAEFTAFLSRYPSAWQAVARLMADRLDWANRRRADMTGYSVEIRLAHVLVELAEHHGAPCPEGVDLGVPLTQVELGRLIGAKEDAVNKAMRRLRDEGLAVTVYRRVILLDLPKLRNFCNQSR